MADGNGAHIWRCRTVCHEQQTAEYISEVYHGKDHDVPMQKSPEGRL